MSLTQQDKQRMQNKMAYFIGRRKTEFDRVKEKRNYLRMDELKKEMKFLLDIGWDLELETNWEQYEHMKSEIDKL